MNFEEKLDSALSTVDILSESQMKHLGKRFIRSSDVEHILREKNIPYMIVGAHALGEVTKEPRATKDVDVVVREEDFDKVIDLITKFFVGTHAEGNRIKNEAGDTLIDVLTDKHIIYKTAMSTGDRIPNPEMILVMKYISSNSPLRRKDKKLQDKADFYNVASRIDVDEEKVLSLLKQADPEIYEFNKEDIIEWIKDAKS